MVAKRELSSVNDATGHGTAKCISSWGRSKTMVCWHCDRQADCSSPQSAPPKCAINSCCNTSQSDTGVTKKSRLPGTPAATHGLRMTRPGHGGRWREPCTRCPLKRAQRWWENMRKNPVRCAARVAQRSSRAWLQRLTHYLTGDAKSLTTVLQCLGDTKVSKIAPLNSRGKRNNNEAQIVQSDCKGLCDGTLVARWVHTSLPLR